MTPQPRPQRRTGLYATRAAFRSRTPLLVAEMLIAWKLWRAGETVNEIARHLGRTATFTRSILFGEAGPTTKGERA